MKKFNQLIEKQLTTLDSLENNSKQLKQEMANPQVINENAQQIEKTKRTIGLLENADYMSQNIQHNVSTKAIIEDIINDMEQEQQDISDDEEKQDIEKNIELLKDVVNNDLQDVSQSAPDIDSTDSFSGFDDF